MNTLVSHAFGLVPLLIPLEVCPKAPPGAQKYADDVMGYVLWGVGIVFFLGLVIAIASLVDGNHVKGSELTKGAHRACACHIRYTVDWAFEPVTTEVQRQGNAAVSTHYGFDLAAYGLPSINKR